MGHDPTEGRDGRPGGTAGEDRLAYVAAATGLIAGLALVVAAAYMGSRAALHGDGVRALAPRATAGEGIQGGAADRLREATETLHLLGYYPDPRGGEPGPTLRHGVAAFQRDAGLSPTGELDPGTLTALQGQARAIESFLRVKAVLLRSGRWGEAVLLDPGALLQAAGLTPEEYRRLDRLCTAGSPLDRRLKETLRGLEGASPP